VLDKVSDNIAGIYANRAGGSVEEWRERMRSETWLSDKEAVELGLADRIDGEEPTKVATRARNDVDFLALMQQQQEDAALVA
jgi:ATP-dependent protease ClpP protease subunit